MKYCNDVEIVKPPYDDDVLFMMLCISRRPIGPAVGFCSQFLVMPLTAYGLGYLLLETTYER